MTRYIRRKSKNNLNLVTPLFLGALTALIPCGVTQAMMAMAVSTSSPMQGALILSGFTLGTMPVFFILAYFTTRLGARLEKNITQFVAVVLLVLGLVALESGLNLAGSPVSVSNLLRSLRFYTHIATPGCTFLFAGVCHFIPKRRRNFACHGKCSH